ncbi:hypothetical protein CEXT_61591 [Caerostris extrusa]|uniref:Uncharacterized protein n=1 Tax=Caerostris extrusa TaxID=172846 RepID=A0AAV4TDR1_CAEEX|nr:hypothetical protein CEXT_61591 [Caerostris extrusa]
MPLSKIHLANGLPAAAGAFVHQCSPPSRGMEASGRVQEITPHPPSVDGSLLTADRGQEITLLHRDSPQLMNEVMFMGF